MNAHALTLASPAANHHILDEKLSGSIVAATTATPRGPPAANLGALSALPVELVQQVLLDMDLRSLANFRAINRRAAHIVDSLPEYKAILQHAPNTVRGAAAIRADGNFTCRTLHTALRTPKCESCERNGEYLYLVTCRRLCTVCLDYDEDNQPVPPADAMQWYGLDRAALDGLPSMRTLPGAYSPMASGIAGGLTLIDHNSVQGAAREFHGAQHELTKFVFQQAFDFRNALNKLLQQPTTQLYPPWHQRYPLRFVAVVRVPWLKTLQEAVWGVH
ncbi:hypothetical protein N657DRAFT_644034 [Parathielavia appendiculata]|uniref:F-box domain-containing protein n=1 Tax=Parathielavia appendiculata TaxID=2587402 RepID=A0AAN6Z4X4_9PEZI|nr:hypothetical protein N657DRAFT_644034 [Parathielavia appendiculata]